ncbi:MAG: anaphase promoting complex subunit cdc16 [Bogoriella megaspora]|nr:MAG: anaphase promoting complex subunit cdc16 [Bogoriella megaspora]
MERFLRDWRQDALNKHQYDSAIFIGDKLLAITNDDKDAFWLAQVHFSTGNYTRAQTFLSRQDLIANNPSCKYLAGHCYIKQGRYDEALATLGEKNPTHLISSPDGNRRKLQGVDLPNGHTKAGKAVSRIDRIDRSEERDQEGASNIKFEASMCYLRGLCYAKQNVFDRAKECYKDAVKIDVQCFEAFDQLMKNGLMSPEEEWKFLSELNFDTIPISGSLDASTSQQAAEFTKMLYTTRLSKYEHPDLFRNAAEELSSHYSLGTNTDIVLSKAELLFTQCRFVDSLNLTRSILDADPHNFSALPVHLACLYELNKTNDLFILSHNLTDSHPEEPSTWLAVGVYYLSISRIAEARRYFSKASMMDPHFGPAWIGFAHTFAAEGEHDQAISAYSTAARLFQGTHLPHLFLGMQNLQLNNIPLAEDYLLSAYDRCKFDPLLLNEMGVVYYHQNVLDRAINLFKLALGYTQDIYSSSSSSSPNGTTSSPPTLSTAITPAPPPPYLTILTNLAHAHRRAGDLSTALSTFDEVLRSTASASSATVTAKGLVLMEMERNWEAVTTFHEALRRSPQDHVAEDLLARALERVDGMSAEIVGDGGMLGVMEEMEWGEGGEHGVYGFQGGKLGSDWRRRERESMSGGF